MYSTNTGHFILFSHGHVNHVFPVPSACGGALLRNSGVCGVGGGVGLVVDRPAE